MISFIIKLFGLNKLTLLFVCVGVIFFIMFSANRLELNRVRGDLRDARDQIVVMHSEAEGLRRALAESSSVNKDIKEMSDGIVALKKKLSDYEKTSTCGPSVLDAIDGIRRADD